MDEIYYDSLANNLIEGKLYAKFGGSYSPGYPIFLSLAYAISNDKEVIYHIMLAISAIVTTSIIFPTYFLLKKYCNLIISIIGSLAVTTLPLLNYNSFTIMTEVLFIPLFLFSIWFILKSYETNDKKWELLASLSVVYLYITRSNGISMLIAFILTFFYYLLSNKKYDSVTNLLKKKWFLIGTFTLFLISWVFFSMYVTDINNLWGEREEQLASWTYGSSYNVFTIFWQAVNGLSTINGLLRIIGCLIYLINYLFLSSYFLLFVAIFFLLMLFIHDKKIINNNASVLIFYLFTTILFLILTTLVFTFISGETLLGRYVEPVIPPIIILSIISIYKIDWKILSVKYVNLFILLFILIILIVLFILMYNSTIILGFLSFVNNPSLYAYTSFYDPFFGINYGQALNMPTWNIPSAALIIVFFLLLLMLIYLSISDKRYICVLLLVIIIFSYFFSLNIYYNELFQSKYESYHENAIYNFIKNNTNSNTLLILDNNEFNNNFYLYNYWNMGDSSLQDIKNNTLVKSQNKKIYLLSNKTLEYDIVACDDYMKLYMI
ncbi:glycosyltransferase family 39 protein [Methanocella paludicola]|nr:glycosyltransferase family 39 protein [Methanocella paludicola]